jgi:hypothetical protein
MTKPNSSAKHISDTEIMEKVRYVQPDSPDIPVENATAILMKISTLEGIPDTQYRIALWPEGVCCILLFPDSQEKPTDAQLIRAYRNCRHSMLAIHSDDQPMEGEAS